MKFRGWMLVLAALLALGLAGCSGGGESAVPETTAPVITAPETETPEQTAPAEPEETDPIQELLDRMTTEEKVGQLLMAGIEGTELGEDARQAIEAYQVGGIILFARNVESSAQLTGLTDDLKALNKENGNIPLLVGMDEEGGLVSRMPDKLEDLPDMYDVGRTGNTQLAYTVGRTLAELCINQGVNLNFAPVLDIWSNPDNTVIGTRAFGTDADTVITMGLPVMEGLRDYGVIPVVKHFPGHGDTSVDSHADLPVVEKTLEELEENELRPFAAAIEQGADVVMVAHILEKELDPDLPASLSPAVITGLLREQLGFDGVVCTDDLTMAAVSNTWGMGEAAVLAVEAGADLLLVCHEADNLTAARDALLEAVDQGRITEARLDESVRRLLTLKDKYGLADEPAPGLDVAAANEVIDGLRAEILDN